MKDYLYDGTFSGLLTCVYLHYYEEAAAGIYTSDTYQSNMLQTFSIVVSEDKYASKVYDAIEKKISAYDLKRIYRVFLSSVENKEMLILNYICLGFKVGSKVSLLHGHPYVHPIEKAEKKVSFEVHRIYGLLRFSVLEGDILYAVIEPDHDILEFIAEHFIDRYKSDPFIIFDKQRKKAIVANEGNWFITDFSEQALPKVSETEKDYRALWKKYFEAIAIKERINPRCQKNFMPVRYWKHLTELNQL